jgi:hypothetical protein
MTVQGIESMTPVQVADNGSTLSVDDGAGSLTVDNAGTFAVQVDGTALTRLTDIETNTDSNAVVGNGAAATAQRVTLANDSTGIIATVGAVTAITNALPAGTNAIGKLAANSGVDIGDVDVTSLPAITGTGTFAVQESGAALTALQLIDDAVFADDAAFTPATSKVGAVGMLADETATDSVDEGDIGIPRMTLDRKQHVVNELESNSIRAAGSALTIKFAKISAASSGNNTLVAAVTSKKIRVLSMRLCPSAAVNWYLTSSNGGTAIYGDSTNKITASAGGNGDGMNFNQGGWFETVAGEALVINLSGAVGVAGCLSYIEV